MPKYRFICPNCSTEKILYVPVSVLVSRCPNCRGIDMERQLPNISGATEVKEVVDPYTNIKWGKDHELVMKKRKDDHFRDIEIPRLVDKYSIETCLENKWLIYNDAGELIINKDWTSSK
jgi:Zn-finger nucleic acid-binding protein